MRTFATLIACLLGAAALAAPAALASPDQESIMQDDGLLLFSGSDQRDATLNEMRTLGTDTIRAFVYWDSVAPDSTSTRPTRLPARWGRSMPSTRMAATKQRAPAIVKASTYPPRAVRRAPAPKAAVAAPS